MISVSTSCFSGLLLNSQFYCVSFRQDTVRLAHEKMQCALCLNAGPSSGTQAMDAQIEGDANQVYVREMRNLDQVSLNLHACVDNTRGS